MDVKLVEPLTQRHLEAFEEAYQAAKVDEVVGVAHASAAMIRCAIKAGWLKGINESELDDMPARDVRLLARDIDAEYARVTRLDPNS